MKLKKKAIIGKNFLFNKNSEILSDDKENINISNNVMMFGKLVSSGKGVISLGEFTNIREGCKIFCSKSVTIGDYVIFADNVIISDTNHHPVHPSDRIKMIKSGWSSDFWKWKHAESSPIIIGSNVWLGQYSRVLKGVEIGENSIVGSNSIVTKNVPPNCIVAGNPAKIVKKDIHLNTLTFD
jgi:maltose O-acetyltransferase